MNAQEKESIALSDRSFLEAFAPLAHHFFPDGCPLTDDDEESNYLQEAWPSNSARRRETVSAETALQSISHTRDYAACHGLTPAELVTVAFVATTATLPTRSEDQPQHAVYSPMRDGSATNFVALVRCLLPKYVVVGREIINTELQKHQENALRIASARLLATGCRFRGVEKNNAAHFDVRRSVLRFLLLASTYCNCLEQSPIVFQWSLHPATSMDALRLLWHLALPIPVFRLKQLQRFYHKMDKEKSTSSVVLAISALLSRYNVHVRLVASTPMKDGGDDWKCFPDADWELEFSGESLCRKCRELTGGNEKYPGEESLVADDLSRRAQNHVAREEGPKPPKRRRLSRRRDLSSICYYVEGLASTAPITFDESRYRNIGTQTLCIATSPVTDILKDSFLQHLYALGVRDETKDWEQLRFQEMLPYKLHEGWFESGDSESSRRDILLSLADWVVRCGSMPAEAQSFVLQNVLATWDGDIDSKMGEIFLYGVLPNLASEANDINVASRENTLNDLPMRIIDTLGRFIVHGNKRVRYAAISGTFSTLVFRWYLLNLSASTRSSENNGVDEILSHPSVSGFREIVERVDEYILKGFLVAEETDEFLCSAATNFRHSVCDVLERFGPIPFSEVVAPSSPLMYRLLLSSSGLNIDRACGLLMRYKSIFQAWKDYHFTDPKDSSTSGRSDLSLGRMRFQEFNCLVWDFCSVLWHSSRPLPPSRSGESEPRMSVLFTELRQSTQEALRKENFPLSILSITHGAAFVQFALDFLETINQEQIIQADDQKRSSSSDRIQGNVKEEYLDYLMKERGMYDLHSFLSTFASSLALRNDRT